MRGYYEVQSKEEPKSVKFTVEVFRLPDERLEHLAHRVKEILSGCVGEENVKRKY